jgi:hypothetical protein
MISKFKGGEADWANEIVGTVARIAYAGSIHGYERIAAARNWLEAHMRLTRANVLAARIARPWWSSAREDELNHALDNWENEGGRCR